MVMTNEFHSSRFEFACRSYSTLFALGLSLMAALRLDCKFVF